MPQSAGRRARRCSAWWSWAGPPSSTIRSAASRWRWSRPSRPRCGMAAQGGMGSDGKEHARHDGGAGQAGASAIAKIAPPAGSQTITIIDGSSGKSKEVVIPGATDAGGKPHGKVSEQDSGAPPRGRPASCWKKPATAPFRKSPPTAPALRSITPIRVHCRPTARMCRASPSSSAVSASALPAPPTHFRSCRRRSDLRARAL